MLIRECRRDGVNSGPPAAMAEASPERTLGQVADADLGGVDSFSANGTVDAHL
jgi:hypothetical protein